MHLATCEKCVQSACVLFLVAVLSIACLAPGKAESYRAFTDEVTGAKIALPLELLTVKNTTKWGTNWSTSDKAINVDTLSLPAGRTLRSLYDQLRKIKGRTLERDHWETTSFELSGRDSDGSLFYVEAHEKNEAVRGYSVVYSSARRTAGEEIIQRLAQSFEPFPSAEAAPVAPEAAALPTAQQVPAVSVPQDAAARPAGDGEYAALRDDVNQLSSVGRYDEAIPVAERALKLAEQRFGADRLATSAALDALGHLYFVEGRYAEAEPLLKRAVAIRERELGGGHFDVSESLDRLGQLYVAQHRYAEAEPVLKRALAIREADPGASAFDINISINNLAALYQAQGRDAEARPLYARLSIVAEGPAVTAQPPQNHRISRGFARQPQSSVESRPDAAGSANANTADWSVVQVFYGTDRLGVDGPARTTYGPDRGHKLRLGRALVTIPRNHQVPKIERPWTISIPYFDYVVLSQAEDPSVHFTMKELKELAKTELIASVRKVLDGSKAYKDHALVFVHGFNTEFDAAVFRVAQIAYDLGFDGAPFVYCWPSGGAVASYTYDRESAGQARRYLREFLDVVTKETGAKSVSIIAHSMGNQPLLEVLKDMMAVPQPVAINQLILAAPDVDADNFSYLANTIKGLAQGITLYAASNDRALRVSRNFWFNPRAGDIPNGKPLVIPGVDTIDVTDASMGILGTHHSSYAESTVLLDDIGKLIKTGVRPPSTRTPNLHAVAFDGGEYWRYQDK